MMMSTADCDRFSRTIASAAAFGAEGPDLHRFLDKKVMLTGEGPVLATENGREIARDARLLLMKICRNVTVALPNECHLLQRELENLATEVAVDEVPRFVDFPTDDDLSAFDAILSVGACVRADLPWTSINSNGWRARVSSGPTTTSGPCDQENPIGALGAACLGACEVFKRLIALKPERGELLDGQTFSFWSDDTGGDDPGPKLRAHDDLALLLVGCGAIGIVAPRNDLMIEYWSDQWGRRPSPYSESAPQDRNRLRANGLEVRRRIDEKLNAGAEQQAADR